MVLSYHDITLWKFWTYFITKIRDNISPGINPARIGTIAVASDQTKTPTLRTSLHIEMVMNQIQGLNWLRN